MRRTIRVYVGESPRVVGVLHHDKQGARESSAFEYDGTWLRDENHYAIDPALPLVSGPQFHRKSGDGSAFPRAIADTEPDGWGRRIILRAHAKRRETARRKGQAIDTRPLDSLDFLLAVDDGSRVGALRFQDDDGVFQGAFEPGRRTAPPLIELGMLVSSSRAFESNAETSGPGFDACLAAVVAAFRLG